MVLDGRTTTGWFTERLKRGSSNASVTENRYKAIRIGPHTMRCYLSLATTQWFLAIRCDPSRSVRFAGSESVEFTVKRWISAG